jgi:hypothetical protein
LSWIKAQWDANGTKILGVLLTMLTALYTVSDDVLDLFPPHSLQRGIMKLIFGLLGYAILKRGETNSRRSRMPPMEQLPPGPLG